jgi:hypothetical protein
LEIKGLKAVKIALSSHPNAWQPKNMKYLIKIGKKIHIKV